MWSSVRCRSLRTYSWTQRGPWLPAAISAWVLVVSVETHMRAPAFAAARAVATSPSGSISRCIAKGATPSGEETGVPSRVVAVLTSATSTSMRGRKRQREYEARFARSVTSSPAPPSK